MHTFHRLSPQGIKPRKDVSVLAYGLKKTQTKTKQNTTPGNLSKALFWESIFLRL